MQSKIQEENKIRTENRVRTLSLITLGLVFLIGGVVTSFAKPEVGASLAGFLAVITPIVYDKLKPISKS